MSNIIVLNDDEIREAASAGIERQIFNMSVGARATYGTRHADGQNHIEGALGEFAVWKYLGMPIEWNLGNFNAIDVGGAYQVRTSPHFSLILHPNDNGEHIFIFAQGSLGTYDIRGWIFGAEGKDPEYWKDPTKKDRWAYFVPAEDLHLMSSLPGASKK